LPRAGADLAGDAVRDLPALRTTMVALVGLIVARTRFLLSEVAALAPWAKRRAMKSSGKKRTQDILCALRITEASKEILVFPLSSHLENRVVLPMKHSKIQELKKGS
jgi:hypothetical protein